MNKPSDAAVRAAEKIRDEFIVGKHASFSREFTYAGAAEIAAIIDAEFEAERTALIAVARAAKNEHSRYRHTIDDGNVTVEFGYFNALDKALASIPEELLT